MDIITTHPTTFDELFEHYLAHPGDYEIRRLTKAEKLNQMLLTFSSLEIDLNNKKFYAFRRALFILVRPNRYIICDADTGEIMAEYDSELEPVYTNAELEEPYHDGKTLNYGELKIVHK